MAKLVLHLPDGSTRAFTLERERLTIGRRADNDICLPFPAVSGEHAAVVTVLDDSFLEDLNSTNGTLVNGQPITKYFLRDRDEIDIGRHTLVYLTGETAFPDPGTHDELHPPVTVTENGGATIGDDEATYVPPARPRAPSAPSPAPDAARRAVLPAALSRIHGQAASRVTIDAHARNDAPAYALEVLDGPLAGSAVTIARDEFVLGRVGAQLAAVRSTSGGYRLVPLEGDFPPRLNGAALPGEGAPLLPGDEIEIAGTRLAWRPAL